MGKNQDLGTFTIDIQLLSNGKFDVYIAHEGFSGAVYADVTADQIGKFVARDIKYLAETYQQELQKLTE